MDKILEALKSLLPADQLQEVAKAVQDALENSKKELESEFDEKLKEAYAELSGELQKAEETAEQGYRQAYEIIQDLNNRLTVQKEEFDRQMENGYEEAYAIIKKEQAKNGEIEQNLSEEIEKRLAEAKDYMIEKVDMFLQFQGEEIYEQAKSQILNDARMVEHKVALDKIIDITANYLSDDDYSAVTSKKIEEAYKALNDLKGQNKILEQRNFRLATENTKLNEAVRQAEGKVLTEGKQERVEKAENASGRGTKKNAGDSVTVIKEHSQAPAKKNDTDGSELFGENAEYLKELQILSGVVKGE